MPFSGPFIPLERGGLLSVQCLPSVQWAPHPSWERRFTEWFIECAEGPSSLLRKEVYPVCSGPSSLLREEVYPVCSGPFIPLEREEVYPVCSGPFIPLETGGLPGVQWALHHSWERRFTQCVVGPSSLLREEVYPVCSGSLIPLEEGGVPSVQYALHPSWERRFT